MAMVSAVVAKRNGTTKNLNQERKKETYMGKYTLKVEGIYKEAFPSTVKRLSFVVGLKDFLSFYEKSIELGNVEKAFFSSFDELTQRPVFYDEGVHVISGGVPWMALYDDGGNRVSEVSANAGIILYDGVDVSDDSGFYEENLFAVLTSREGSRKVEDDGSVVFHFPGSLSRG